MLFLAVPAWCPSSSLRALLQSNRRRSGIVPACSRSFCRNLFWISVITLLITAYGFRGSSSLDDCGKSGLELFPTVPVSRNSTSLTASMRSEPWLLRVAAICPLSLLAAACRKCCSRAVNGILTVRYVRDAVRYAGKSFPPRTTFAEMSTAPQIMGNGSVDCKPVSCACFLNLRNLLYLTFIFLMRMGDLPRE